VLEGENDDQGGADKAGAIFEGGERELYSNCNVGDLMTQQKREKSFNIFLPGEKLRFRNILKIKKDDLTIQLEINLGKWKPVIRWDRGPHEFFHRHLIYSNGYEEREKTNTQELNKVIEDGIEDLKKNLKSYLEKTGYQKFLGALLTDIDIESDLDDAKRFLLDLVEHPEKIDSATSRGRLKLGVDVILKNEVSAIKKS